jgi:hypothetical protein
MNWGYKLMFTFFAFGGMMGYLVYRAVTTNFELVEKDYYKNELRYQQVIDGTKRAQLLGELELVQRDDKIFLQLPPEMSGKKLDGSVWFYCAYDASKDRKFALQTDTTGSQSFELAGLGQAIYTVKISWDHAGENYYAEKKFKVQ